MESMHKGSQAEEREGVEEEEGKNMGKWGDLASSCASNWEKGRKFVV